MKFRSLMTAICVLASANIVSAAPFAYIANGGTTASSTKKVSVIDTATNAVTATVDLPVDSPKGLPYAYSVAVGASGQYVYVGLQDANEVAIIDAARNVVVKRIGLGNDSPGGLAVNAAETRLYIASNKSNTLIVSDISGIHIGFVPTEVGRVVVADESVSNPNGVVISSGGDKAYVANTTTGKVAEVSLDEANNLYTRTALITVGSQPTGLALSSDDSKLYVASFSGNAAVVDTATRAVTNLSVGNGNVSVAVSADNSKAYVPSGAEDKLYVINNGNPPSVSPSTYDVASAPFGSAIAPNGNLYLAMNSSDNVQVFNTASNTVTATIPLYAGAKPTSVGDFTGPQFTRTITSSSSSANCPILPLGAVAVAENSSRYFSVKPEAGKTCDIKVDGVSVSGASPTSYPTGYLFTEVTANHTIAASEITAGTFRTVNASWISPTGGYLVSTPFGINNGSSSARFVDGTTVTLECNSGFTATGWSGDCAGTVGKTCTLSSLAADKTVAAFCIAAAGGSGPIKNQTKSTYHQTCSEATAAATSIDEIRISSTYTSGCTTTGTAGVTVKLSGNWDAGHTSQSGSVSMGALTITNVAVIADNLTL